MKVNDSYTVTHLEWDTNHFGVNSTKLLLHDIISASVFSQLLIENSEVEFLTIVNENSNPTNAKLIGETTTAFLADINIQFQKASSEQTVDARVNITNEMKYDEQILKLASFQVSRFIEDPILVKKNGDQVYKEWINNAFNSPFKYFATYVSRHNKIDGFVLFSVREQVCVIELIAVTSTSSNSGIGSKLFKAVESYAYKNGIPTLQVGTQIRNLNAINFYHKMGCKQVGCHQVFHYWTI